MREPAWRIGAYMIEHVRVNRVRFDAHRQVYIKTRRALPPGLIHAGNLFMRLSDSGCQMFPSARAWREHELAMFRALHGHEHAGPHGADGIWTACLPGVTARELLESQHIDLLDALAKAASALSRMHARGLTHGDAHLGNVVCGEEAAWFDFDARHDPRRPMSWRQADDLFVMLLELAGFAPSDQMWGESADAIIKGYDQVPLPSADLIARLELKPTGFAKLMHAILTHRAPGERTLARQRSLAAKLSSSVDEAQSLTVSV